MSASWRVDAIAEVHGFGPVKKQFQGWTQEGRIGTEKVLLLKPATFMNDSGRAIGEALRFYKLDAEALTVFHDELDLAPFKVKVKTGGGTAGHNGLRSIDQHLGPDFRRVRIGIGHPGHKDRVTGYVLGNYAKSEIERSDRHARRDRRRGSVARGGRRCALHERGGAAAAGRMSTRGAVSDPVLRGTARRRRRLSRTLPPPSGRLRWTMWQDGAGRREHGYRGYTSYASLNDLPQRDPAFADLKRLLDRHVAAFAADCGFELGGRSLKLDSLWVNLLKPGGTHSGHIHPHSVVSGTCYVAVPPGSGALKLEDPRLPMLMAAPPLRAGHASSMPNPPKAACSCGKAGCATR